MIHETIKLKVMGSQPGARLITYIQDYSPAMATGKRPLVLLCPGGGYGRTSDRESEPMALEFLRMGYHAAILRYSCEVGGYPTALVELATAMLLLRERAGEWHIDAEKIAVQGCSAGGHLAASLGMFWDEAFLLDRLGLTGENRGEMIKPYGMLLCYPVITSGEFAHRGSFDNLLGDRKNELSEAVSLEKHVSDKTPKTFIWHTFSDQSVPVENSLLLVSALRKFKIPTEFHMYPIGPHGLALATELTATSDGRNVQEECSSWMGLAGVWLESLFAGKLDVKPISAEQEVIA